MLVFDSLWASIKTKISSFHQSIFYKHVTDLQQEYMIVPFVDNGGINDHHCLNFLSIIRIVRSLSGNLATILSDNRYSTFLQDSASACFMCWNGTINKLATILFFIMSVARCFRQTQWSGQTKDYKIGICCFSAKHAALRRKSKDWFIRNQDNVSEWGNMSIRGLLFQWASTIKIQLFKTPLPMVYWTPYPWYINPPYPWYFAPPPYP